MLVVATEFEDIFHECESFSVITQNLSRSIGEAQKFLEEFKVPTVTNADKEDDIFYDCPIGASYYQNRYVYSNLMLVTILRLNRSNMI